MNVTESTEGVWGSALPVRPKPAWRRGPRQASVGGPCPCQAPLQALCPSEPTGAQMTGLINPFPGARAVCKRPEIRLSGAAQPAVSLHREAAVWTKGPGGGGGLEGAGVPCSSQRGREGGPPATLQLFINPELTSCQARCQPPLGNKAAEPQPPACQDLQVAKNKAGSFYPGHTE